MMHSEYFTPVKNLTFHDLTTGNILPASSNSLLGLGLKFIPTPKYNITNKILDVSLSRFERDIGLKVFFSGDPTDSYDTSSNTNTLRIKSIWRAPFPPQEIDTRIEHFCRAIRNSFVPTVVKLNLTPLEQKTLREIKNNPEITIAAADKNLGPVGINTSQYIEWGMKHLMDTSTYELLTEESAFDAARNLSREIFEWTRRHRESVPNEVIHYIRYHLDKANKDPFGYFYLLIKLHKSPISTRPVCSDCASLPHALGKWVNTQLQPIVQRQATYFKDSYALKKMLDKLTLPPNATIFTYDAVSMYTNIDTDDCIDRLTEYLLTPQTNIIFPHLS